MNFKSVFMQKENTKTYHFNTVDFDKNGRRLTDGKTLRGLVKDFERDFHESILTNLKKVLGAVEDFDCDFDYAHSTEYASCMYANRQTMNLLAKSNNAEPFMSYGMELYHGPVFNPAKDSALNKNYDKWSETVLVYGIDSAFLTEFDEYGYPVIDVDAGIYPLTLLIDNTMGDGEIRLASSLTDDGVMIYVPEQICAMETKPDNVVADLTHTPNGEWIYDHHTFCVPESLSIRIKAMAKRQGRELLFHKMPVGLAWCYKREIRDVSLRHFPLTIGELEIMWSILNPQIVRDARDRLFAI